MKTTTFNPKSCAQWTDDDGVTHEPTFRGNVELKIPNFFERSKLKVLLMTAVSGEGDTDVEALKEGKGKVNVVRLMEKMASLVEASVPFYQRVELVNLKTNVTHNSFESLSCDSSADGILQEIAQELANGFSISKN